MPAPTMAIWVFFAIGILKNYTHKTLVSWDEMSRILNTVIVKDVFSGLECDSQSNWNLGACLATLDYVLAR